MVVIDVWGKEFRENIRRHLFYGFVSYHDSLVFYKSFDVMKLHIDVFHLTDGLVTFYEINSALIIFVYRRRMVE